jgi:tetratricopeptide (TPR) repeat protein
MFKFGLSNPLNPKAVKAIVNSGSLSAMDEMSSLNEAKCKLQNKNINVDEQYNTIYNEGLSAINLYAKSPVFDEVNLRKAAKKFAEAIEIRKHNPEPYFYLAYIFYHLQYEDLAKKYYEIARLINPKLRGLKTLNKFFSEEL